MSIFKTIPTRSWLSIFYVKSDRINAAETRRMMQTGDMDHT